MIRRSPKICQEREPYMTGDKISIIVPIYNLAPWLGRCVESILAQTCENLEVILVDDGSGDDSLAIAR